MRHSASIDPLVDNHPDAVAEHDLQPALTGSRARWRPARHRFTGNDVRYASEVRPSNRGELEITDLNLRYLRAGVLEVARMGRGFARLDAGTFESLIDAASLVQTIEQRQGMKIACPEEIAYRMGFIGRTQLRELAHSLMKNAYGEYLARLVDNE